ncbi:zinc-binding dehydrogenase, partial [Phenylobacterium aquaticum]
KMSGASITNITVGDRAGLIELTRAVTMSGLRPVIDRVFPFEAAREAFTHLESGAHMGKVVIRGLAAA